MSNSKGFEKMRKSLLKLPAKRKKIRKKSISSQDLTELEMSDEERVLDDGNLDGILEDIKEVDKND